MVDIARGDFELKELAMTEEPALGMQETRVSPEIQTQRLGALVSFPTDGDKCSSKPRALFQAQGPGYCWHNLLQWLCIDYGNYITKLQRDRLRLLQDLSYGSFEQRWRSCCSDIHGRIESSSC